MSDGDPHGCFSTLEAAGDVDGREKMQAPSLVQQWGCWRLARFRQQQLSMRKPTKPLFFMAFLVVFIIIIITTNSF